MSPHAKVALRDNGVASYQNLSPFAIETIERVRHIAKLIQERHGRHNREVSQFCNSLSNVLWSIKLSLRKSPNSHDERKKKVEGLLNNLERLCSWPRSLSKSSIGKGTKRWPTLNALQDLSHMNKAIECIRSFASTYDSAIAERRLEMFKKFRNFSSKTTKAEVIEANEAQPSESISSVQQHKLQQVGFELDNDIKRLYHTLLQYRLCEEEGSQQSIATHIRLSGYRSLLTDEATAEFGVLFFDHPHVGDCHWQEVCIQIWQPRPPMGPKVQFSQESSEQRRLSQPHTSHTPITCASFCKHISGRSQAQLLLSSQNGELLMRDYRDVSRNWITSQQAVPLAALLDEPKAKFTEKMKAVLALLLARSTVQFYDSDLIGQGLTKEDIQFLFEERDRIDGVYVNEPMLLLRFKDDDTNESETQREIIPKAMIHDMPKILALGLLFLELETRTSLESYRDDPDLCPPGAININTDYRIAGKLLDPNHPAYILSEMDPLSPFRNILPTCIKPGELARKMGKNLSAQKNINVDLSSALRSVIYSEIVLPLEKWVSKFEKPNTVKVLYKLVQKRFAAAPRSIKASRYVLSNPEVQKVAVSGINNEDRKRQLSQQWFENYDRLKDTLQSQEAETGMGYERIKIAVLDTGINLDDHNYYRHFGIIAEYKDYVTNNCTNPDDETGHGSDAVSLLARTCPNASLYLARVLKTNSPTRLEVKNVVDAINWATKHEVNIITMALGFREYQPEIAEAVAKARSKKILIFSAASNSQNMERIYFPAKDHRQVFGIFSTNAGNRESRDLNPSPDDRQHSLAIFGEGVEIAEDKPLLSGTSYSTSIAAGLAGMLLDFSRQETDKEDVPDISHLSNMEYVGLYFKYSQSPIDRLGRTYEDISATGQKAIIQLRRNARTEKYQPMKKPEATKAG
ncbi:serine threonine kinase [Fusarium mexicanum]|uniref:Serine threonine kinase n=1 Tax=Fusarium mexicanum TaxID=751941 RepID=A0A8H5IFD1_9HYPO|nr:serine threonine kinase [Fusarium mexicanum]